MPARRVVWFCRECEVVGSTFDGSGEKFEKLLSKKDHARVSPDCEGNHLGTVSINALVRSCSDIPEWAQAEVIMCLESAGSEPHEEGF